MSKSPDAFRTISEVAEWLNIQAHVLRFWESKFTQVKPIKRAGGRRYYRPADMLLLGGIKRLLHDDGLTIKGVQKILREEGMSHVAALSAAFDDSTQTDGEDNATDSIEMPEAPVRESVVLPFDAAPSDSASEEKLPTPPPETVAAPDNNADEHHETPLKGAAVASDTSSDVHDIRNDAPARRSQPEPVPPVTADPEDASQPAPITKVAAEAPPQDTPAAEASPVAPSDSEKQDTPPPKEAAEHNLPEFLRTPLTDPAPSPSDNTPVAPPVDTHDAPEAAPTPAPPPAAKPRVVDLPPIPDEADIPASPRALSAILKRTAVSADAAKEIAPLMARLTALRESMSQPRRPAAKD